MANAAVRATPQSSLLPLFLRHFQPFPAPQPIHPFDVHAKSFAPQQRPRSTVAIAWMAPNPLQHPLHQGPLAVAFLGHVSLRGPRLFDHLAGPALRHLPRRLRFLHRLLAARRAHHFPRNVSSRICLSRVRSATSFFSRPFSTCSSLIFFASFSFLPPVSSGRPSPPCAPWGLWRWSPFPPRCGSRRGGRAPPPPPICAHTSAMP